MKKKNISNIIVVGVLIIGLALLIYPTFSDYWNSLYQSKAISSYKEIVNDIDDTEYEEMINDAKEYNKTLTEGRQTLMLTESELETYNSLLNINGNGIMGYVEIPKIKVQLSIYHGVSDEVLQIAVGHIEGTSLPVGGASTHSVISGHRGLPSAKLFSNLDQLSTGDIFMISILDEVLTYEIDQILIVEPNEISPLYIEEGKDYVTLVTCTPYGVNTHRLLVRGHRIENNALSNQIHVVSDATQIEPLLVASSIAIPILVILFIGILIPRKPKH